MFAVIAFLVLVVYSPSFLHGPRADHIPYLAEVGHKQSLWDLTIGSLDLNRHRQFNPGDEILFRPVSYIFLGAEKFFFGYNFLLWQGMGIVLHLAVVWFLLRLLLQISPGWPAVFTTAFFAFLFINMEMVTWHHINAYMIFVIGVLAALRRFHLVLTSRAVEYKNYLGMFLWLTLAAFTHEMGSVVAIAFAAALWFLKPHERRFLAWLLAVPLVYTVFSLFDARVNPFTFTKSLPPTVPTGPGAMFYNWLYAIGSWGYAGIFPGELQWLFAARNMISPDEKDLIKPLHLNVWATSLALCVVAGYMWCLLKQKGRDKCDAKKMTGLMGLMLAGIFAAIIAVGRGGQIAMWDVLRVNTYYMYIFWVFALVGFFSSVDWLRVQRQPQQLLAFFTVCVILCNGLKLYPALDKQARENNDILVLIRTMEMLVKEHGHEPDFSFYVDARYPGNYIYKEMRHRDNPVREYTLMEAMYPRYFTAQSPKYKFLVK